MNVADLLAELDPIPRHLWTFHYVRGGGDMVRLAADIIAHEGEAALVLGPIPAGAPEPDGLIADVADLIVLLERCRESLTVLVRGEGGEPRPEVFAFSDTCGRPGDGVTALYFSAQEPVDEAGRWRGPSGFDQGHGAGPPVVRARAPD